MAAVCMRSGATRIQRTRDRQSFPPIVSQSSVQGSFPNQNQTQKTVQSQNPNNRGNISREYQKENKDTTPPGDWVGPKIFKGSSNVG